MIGLGGGKLKSRLNVGFLKIGVVAKNVFLRDSGRKKV